MRAKIIWNYRYDRGGNVLGIEGKCGEEVVAEIIECKKEESRNYVGWQGSVRSIRIFKDDLESCKKALENFWELWLRSARLSRKELSEEEKQDNLESKWWL